MEFISTRGGERVGGPEAVVKGIASDGGLFVPADIPEITEAEFEDMLGMDYAERTCFLLGKYFGEYEEGELSAALRAAYAKFDGDPVPLVRMDEGLYILELFHGPTCADKDLPFSAFAHLLTKGRDLLGIREPVLLLVATSGDAGKAALESFRDREGVKVMVFYPEDGVSKMQKLQMCTQEGENLNVVAVRGVFDDCRRGVRKILVKQRADVRERGYLLSSANSVNFGSLAPRICAYFSAYCDLVSSGQIGMGKKADFCIPAGNLGNILAAYYAKRMGLPAGRLLCASNKNNAFPEFWKTGTYDGRRPCFRTMSSPMDVLVPFDLERLLFELSGRDAALTAERMASLASAGKFSLRDGELEAFRSDFYADSVSEDDTVDCMYEFFMEYGYPMDTQTGVAMCVAQRYSEKLGEDPAAERRPMVVLSAASPYKFPQDVLYALSGNDVKDSFKGVKRINFLTAMKVPEPIKSVRYKPVRFKTAVNPEKMFDEVLKFLD